MKNGFALLELLLAIALFSLGVAAAGLLNLDASLAANRSADETQALLLAEEGLAAARALRNGDFDNLAAGTHGIVESGGAFMLSGSFDMTGPFRREVRIADVDSDTKRIESEIAWQGAGGREGAVVLTTYLTDWEQTQGEGGDFFADAQNAGLTGGELNTVNGITLQNAGSSVIQLGQIRASWDGPHLLTEARIDGSTVYANAAGTPSGTLLDITDTSFAAGSEKQLELAFNGAAAGTEYLLAFFMSDASTFFSLTDTLVAESSFLVINTSNAKVGGQGRRFINQINLTNTSATRSITIARMLPTWDKTSNIISIRIGGAVVWTGSAASGTDLNITDVVLLPSASVTIEYLEFNRNMQNATLDILFTMGDGSQKSSGSFSP